MELFLTEFSKWRVSQNIRYKICRPPGGVGGHFFSKRRYMKSKLEIETRNRRSKSKLEIRNRSSKLKLEIDARNPKSKLEIETRNRRSKSKLEIRNRRSKSKLKIEHKKFSEFIFRIIYAIFRTLMFGMIGGVCITGMLGFGAVIGIEQFKIPFLWLTAIGTIVTILLGIDAVFFSWVQTSVRKIGLILKLTL